MKNTTLTMSFNTERLDDRIAREENARPSRPNRQRNADRQSEDRDSV